MPIFLIGTNAPDIGIDDRLSWVWRSDAYQNLIAIACLVGVGWLLRYASQQEYWRNAARQIRRNRLAIVCLFVLLGYLLVGVLDSIGWRDPLIRQTDQTLTRNESGAIVYRPRGLSLLDRLCTPLRERTEKTYSAPLAIHLYAKSTLQMPDGRTVRDYPPLQYPRSHLLGTDKVGSDVLYRALKGIRTGLIIGGFTTLIAVPFAIFFGVIAGYFGGWIDDAVQYIYATLDSIPSILLIVAFMLLFGQGLFNLCLIMGIRSWTGLCRILRGETLKLRELEYIQASEAFGVHRGLIILKHLVPNLMHIVLISTILRFSGLVLAEALLSYLQIGVEPTTGSWGNMINTARLELARDPIVWWNLAAAFAFMFGLVLPANLFGDAVRDALDPRLRTE
jgi:peptide/nickel transport system permease protein